MATDDLTLINTTHHVSVEVSFDLNETVSKRLAEERAGIFSLQHVVAHSHQHVQRVPATKFTTVLTAVPLSILANSCNTNTTIVCNIDFELVLKTIWRRMLQWDQMTLLRPCPHRSNKRIKESPHYTANSVLVEHNLQLQWNNEGFTENEY